MADPIPLVLKFEDWPRADKAAWNSLFTPGDIFDGQGPCANWSDGSRAKRRQSYGQWLSFVVRTDPTGLNELPSERITPNRVRAYLEECEARLQPSSTAGLVTDLYVVANSIAPERNWTWLETGSKRLIAQADRCALPAPHPVSAGKIFSWALTHMENAEANASLTAIRRAIWFRQALLIGFLISRPVRRRALIAMCIGRHIQPVSSGFALRFGAEDMKDKKVRSFSLPKKLNEPMQRYLVEHRPVLLRGKSSDALWINQYGNALTADGLSRELPKITARHLGVELRPHAFRSIAATSIAETDPEHVNIIRDLLGHATLDMAERHYNRATGVSSCNGLQSIVEDIQRTVPIMGRAKRVLKPPKGATNDPS